MGARNTNLCQFVDNVVCGGYSQPVRWEARIAQSTDNSQLQRVTEKLAALSLSRSPSTARSTGEGYDKLDEVLMTHFMTDLSGTLALGSSVHVENGVLIQNPRASPSASSTISTSASVCALGMLLAPLGMLHKGLRHTMLALSAEHLAYTAAPDLFVRLRGHHHFDAALKCLQQGEQMHLHRCQKVEDDEDVDDGTLAQIFLLSLRPAISDTPDDNRCHLKALRHLQHCLPIDSSAGSLQKLIVQFLQRPRVALKGLDRKWRIVSVGSP